MTQTALPAWCGLADRRQPHFLPEAVVETLYVQLPNDNNEAAAGSIIEPISLRVSLLDSCAISGITEPFLAACERQAVRLHMALRGWFYVQASRSALRNTCLIFGPIHSVTVAKPVSASCQIHVLIVERHGAQIAIQKKSGSSDGLDLIICTQSRLCGNSKRVGMEPPHPPTLEWLM
jgi:hypothetical protein